MTEQPANTKTNKVEAAWRLPALLLATCLGLYFLRLGNFGILEGGESYYPAACREMIRAHEWIVPQLNYQIYFSKPIMTFWLIESAYTLFGVTELAGRLWSSVLSTVLVFFCYFTTRALAGTRAGLLAALMLASSPLMVATARRSSIDVFFSCFFGFALCAMVLVLFANRKRWWPVIYLGLALAALSKGPAALVLFVGGLVGYLILQKSSIKQTADCMKELRIVPGTILFLVTVLPWCIAVSQATKGLFLKVFFLYENLSRFTGNTNSGKHPHWWAYLPALAYGAFPWSLLLPASLVDGFTLVKKRFAGERTADVPTEESNTAARPERVSTTGDIPNAAVRIFSLAYILVTVIFFSVSRTQFDRYILPIWCPLVIIISLGIEDWLRKPDLKSLIGSFQKFVSPFLAALGIISLVASVIASVLVKDAQLWMRIVAPLGIAVLAGGWVWQYLLYRQKNFSKSIMVLALSTCAGYSIATPVLFEYWYEKTYAGVHELVKSVSATDADVAQYKEFMPSLLYYRQGPVFFFYHLSQLVPRHDSPNSIDAKLSSAPPTPRVAGARPADPRLFILVKKDFEPELLAQPQLHLKLKSRNGEWSIYETSDYVFEKPPTLEQSFNRLDWKDSMTDRFGFGPLTVPYSGGNKLWIR